ncbi:uncharacterized protein YjiS (DUF1127 family) [Bartonella japonica]|uniref:Uncharacterized protein YjiS (DUF1127 family) n=1 Tax=Bartonella japonica TaxID=357761 RepID=A0ABV2FLN8_9HYPH
MNILCFYSNWRHYRRTVKALSCLSANELNDLGICRGDIELIARHCSRKS